MTLIFLQMRIIVSAVLLVVACRAAGYDVIEAEDLAANKMFAALRDLLLVDKHVVHRGHDYEQYMQTRFRNDGTPLRIPALAITKKAFAENQVCRMVCIYCRVVASLRVSALCDVQCTRGGRGPGFIACFTYWSNREFMRATVN